MEQSQIFDILKTILKQFEADLSVIHDKDDNYYLNTSASDKKKKPEFFGAVQIKKSYVAFHLMPLYYHPDLLGSISPQLKSRIQGKSCFNFKEVDDRLSDELNVLTQAAFDRYRVAKK